MKFARYAFLVLLVFVFFSCSKIKEMKSIGENLSNITETAKAFDGMVNSDEEYDLSKFSMSEDDVRKFYRAVERLMKKYPSVHFEIPYGSAAEAMKEGINLKKTIEAETDYDFDEFNQAALSIFAVRTRGIGSEYAAAIDSSQKDLEGFDAERIEGLDDEERAAVDESVRDGLAEVEGISAELDGEEMVKIRENYDMINRVRAEFDIPE